VDSKLPLNMKFDWQDINKFLKVSGFEDEPIKLPTPEPIEVKPLKRYMWDTAAKKPKVFKNKEEAKNFVEMRKSIDHKKL